MASIRCCFVFRPALNLSRTGYRGRSPSKKATQDIVIPGPSELERLIESGDVPLRSILENADCDALLEARASSADFEIQRNAAWEEIEKLRFILNRSTNTKSLCERCFKIVFDCTEHQKIAACVADDFGLIGSAGFFASHESVHGYRNTMIDWMWNEYLCGRLPVPP